MLVVSKLNGTNPPKSRLECKKHSHSSLGFEGSIRKFC